MYRCIDMRPYKKLKLISIFIDMMDEFNMLKKFDINLTNLVKFTQRIDLASSFSECTSFQHTGTLCRDVLKNVELHNQIAELNRRNHDLMTENKILAERVCYGGLSPSFR